MTYALAPFAAIGMSWAMIRVAVDPELAALLALLIGG